MRTKPKYYPPRIYPTLKELRELREFSDKYGDQMAQTSKVGQDQPDRGRRRPKDDDNK